VVLIRSDDFTDAGGQLCCSAKMQVGLGRWRCWRNNENMDEELREGIAKLWLNDYYETICYQKAFGMAFSLQGRKQGILDT